MTCKYSGCTSLTSVIIPNSVTRIGSNAFEGCTNLTSIKIPQTVTDIGNRAFANCPNLTPFKIPTSVKYIGKDIFGQKKLDDIGKYKVEEVIELPVIEEVY